MPVQHSDGTSTPLIDASVHIFAKSTPDLRSYLGEPYASRGFPDYEMEWWGTPGGEYTPAALKTGESYPGSDPDITGRVLFDERGVDVAVLHPMTRGIMPDFHLGAAIAGATNRILVERWLDSGEYADRYRGTIRVVPEDVAGAIREIERWKDHPQVVQVGIPLQTRELYGRPQFWPLWEAVAEAGLPVVIHSEVGNGITLPVTPNGQPRTYEQYATFTPLNFLYHLFNMIAEGVFERNPNLKVIWADGAGDFITPFIWRFDTFGRPHLEQTPWAPKMPSDYLPGHVFFVQGALDGPGPEADFGGEWMGFTNKQDMFLFGSSYPHWQLNSPERFPHSLTPEQRERIFWRNAAELYGIEIPAAAGAR